MNNRVEILAPAGSIEAMHAAFAAGADAVYIGGQQFGARAFAGNPGQDDLLRAIDEAHLLGRKLYLTVNTLLKNKELFGQLETFIRPVYEQGLDAVLVQDYGVMSFFRDCFPDLPLHASTQMTVCGPDYGIWLGRQNVRRLVLPRELNLDEIREMKKKTGLEIEVFVHGALCYAYSGQCLLSSMIGGRSGNRGRCAQPCRMAYTFADGSARKQGYLLSMKDLCGLEMLPQLIEAGVDSLKIEGRMKKPEYAAMTSMLYRHYRDLYLEKGADSWHVDPDDIRKLMDLYNRGGFTKGYYMMHNGPEMITPDRPNHSGIEAGKITKVSGDLVSVKLDFDVNAGDVLEFPDLSEITVSSGARQGQTLKLKKGAGRMKAGQTVRRTRNAGLIQELTEVYVKNPDLKEKIYGFVSLLKDSPAKMTLYDGAHSVTVSGEAVQSAQNRPLTADDVRKQMEKTGATLFRFEKLDIELDEGVFIPVRSLNELRRMAFEAFEAEKAGSFRRQAAADHSFLQMCPAKTSSKKPTVHVLVLDQQQLDIILRESAVSRVYIELYADEKWLRKAADDVHAHGKECFIAMPHIWRKDIAESLEKKLLLLKGLCADGFLIRNMESLFWLDTHQIEGIRLADYSIYTMNDAAADVISGLFDEQTLPVELNRSELMNMRHLSDSEMIVYGRLQLMVSAGCLLKTCGSCSRQPGIHYLRDRMKKNMVVRNVCPWCYNLLDNADPLFIPEVIAGDLGGRYPRSVRLQFIDEGHEEVRKVLDTFCHNTVYKPQAYTKGHYKRGVD